MDIDRLAVKRLLATERLELNPADMEASVILSSVEQEVRYEQVLSSNPYPPSLPKSTLYTLLACVVHKLVN